MDRRSFLRFLTRCGGIFLTSRVMSACNSTATETESWPGTSQGVSTPSLEVTPIPSETGTPTSSPEVSATYTASGGQEMTQVAFVKTDNRAEGVRRALELFEIAPIRGKNVFLKPNFNSADPAPGSTHDDTLREIVLYLKNLDAERIMVGDRSGMGDTETVMRQKDIFRMAEELGFDTIVFDHLEREDWVSIPADDSHWERGFAFARPALEADSIIQTCCLKTHRFGGHFTLSLKNSVGFVAKFVPGESFNYMSELHGSPHQRQMIAEINSAYKPDLIVMDGVEAFVNAGPDQGKRVDAHVILAGTDRVALDAVGVALLRYHGTTTDVSKGRIFEQEQIARAVELGLGISSPIGIELVTGDLESQVYADQIREILQQG